jgi:hypothetical protein
VLHHQLPQQRDTSAVRACTEINFLFLLERHTRRVGKDVETASYHVSVARISSICAINFLGSALPAPNLLEIGKTLLDEFERFPRRAGAPVETSSYHVPVALDSSPHAIIGPHCAMPTPISFETGNFPSSSLSVVLFV